jgi:hypothetical protein
VLQLLSVLFLNVVPNQPQVRLVYDAGDTGCPARDRLASAVMARLGYDAFNEDAVETVSVQLRRSPGGLRAQVIRSTSEGMTGQRELDSPTTDCTELFRAMELAVAIAIDPRAGLIRPTAPAPAPVIASVQVPVQRPVAAPEPRPPPVPTVFHLGLGPTGSLGTGPTATFGLGLVGGIRHGLFELSLGGRVELPSVRVLSPGSFSTQTVVGNLNVCLAVSLMRACALAELGALRVTSTGLTPAAQQTAILAGLGARLGIHFQAFEHLAVRPFFNVGASLARTSVVANGKVVWTTSPVMGTLGLAFVITSSR